jgi:hypothetical protein
LVKLHTAGKTANSDVWHGNIFENFLLQKTDGASNELALLVFVYPWHAGERSGGTLFAPTVASNLVRGEFLR